MSVHTPPSTPKIKLTMGPMEYRILEALARYHYITAEQVCFRSYSQNSLPRVRSKLLRMIEGGYVKRNRHPSPHNPEFVGSTPFVYFLTDKGRAWLKVAKVQVDGHLRHAGPVGYILYPHTLSINDFLIQAEHLCQTYRQIEAYEVWHDRDLRRQRSVRVSDKGSRPITVVPDAWVDFHINGQRFPISLELDRGTEQQREWREKVRGILTWCAPGGPYEELYGTSAITVAVVATPGPARSQQLRHWTELELKHLGLERESELFYFLGVDPKLVTPEELFLEPRWVRPFDDSLYSLLEYEHGNSS